MPSFPGSEQWMIGSGYELLVISSIGGPNLNELSAPIHNSRPDPIPARGHSKERCQVFSLQTQFAMRTKTNELQYLIIGHAVDQH